MNSILSSVSCLLMNSSQYSSPLVYGFVILFIYTMWYVCTIPICSWFFFPLFNYIRLFTYIHYQITTFIKVFIVMYGYLIIPNVVIVYWNILSNLMFHFIQPSPKSRMPYSVKLHQVFLCLVIL